MRADDLLEVHAGFFAERGRGTAFPPGSAKAHRNRRSESRRSNLAIGGCRAPIVPPVTTPLLRSGNGTPPSLPFQESKPDVCPHKAHLKTRPIERNLSHELRPLEGQIRLAGDGPEARKPRCRQELDSSSHRIGTLAGAPRHRQPRIPGATEGLARSARLRLLVSLRIASMPTPRLARCRRRSCRARAPTLRRAP